MIMEREIATVPVASIEVLVSHYVRIIKWLVLALVLSICLLFGSFAVTYFMGTETVETREIAAEQDGDGTNLIGGGDITFGTESSHQND